MTLKLILILWSLTIVGCSRITLNDRYDLDLSTECIPTLPDHIDSHFSGINTHNLCVHLYKEQHCSGPYLIVAPGTPGHGSLGTYGFSNNVRSIGPCFERCHPDKIQDPGSALNATVNIYLGGSPSNYESPRNQFTVEAGKCLDISQEMNSWELSVFRAELSTSVCLELYDFGDCSGPSIHLTIGEHSRARRITFWLGRKEAGSLSFCGYGCNSTDKQLLDGSVTLFRGSNFTGDRAILELGGCTPLPRGWSGTIPPKSVIVGGCVVFYEDEGCDTQPPLIEVMGGAAPQLYWPANKTLKAIMECPPEVLERYGGNGGGSGWGWVLLVILLLLIICGVGVIVWKMEDVGKAWGRYQVNNSVKRDHPREDGGRFGTNSRLPDYNKMETPLIEINS